MSAEPITTIRRNSKRYLRALETATDCQVYSLSNYFIAKDCNPLALVRYMSEDALLGQCKLTACGDRYTLHVHSNLWFEFSAK